jgi:hypothetical protein
MIKDFIVGSLVVLDLDFCSARVENRPTTSLLETIVVAAGVMASGD